MSFNIEVVPLSTAQVVTTTAVTPSGQLDDSSKYWVAVHLAVTAVTGTTPSLATELQWSNDGVTFLSAETPDTLTAVTAAVSKCKQFSLKGKFFRLAYTATGTTPSFTITATALCN